MAPGEVTFGPMATDKSQHVLYPSFGQMIWGSFRDAHSRRAPSRLVPAGLAAWPSPCRPPLPLRFALG